MAHDVFISHSSKDKAADDAVCAALESNGVRCWIAPRDIRPGESWAKSILRGIADCRMMVLIFSGHTNGSEHIRREVERAVHRGIAIAPIRIVDVMPQDELEYFLSSSHWMDALTPPLTKHLRDFTAKVKGLLQLDGSVPNPALDLSAAEAGREAGPRHVPSKPRGRGRTAVLLLSLLVLAGLATAAWISRNDLRRALAGGPDGAARPATAPANLAGPTTVPATAPAAAPASAPAVPGAAPSPPETEAHRAAGEQAARKARLDASAKEFTNTLGMKLKRIEPGTFIMGSPEGEKGRAKDETQHRVTLTKPFFMGVHFVTRGQFASFAKDKSYQTDAERDGWAYAWAGTTFEKVDGASWRVPGFDQTDDHPVVEVSWNDAVEYCKWLSGKEGKSYRLPTEAEFEYACRAGTKTAYFWGDDPDAGQGFANCADLTLKDKIPSAINIFNWRDGFVFTSPVGSFKPNPWGLYDMIGNAWEWCSDVYEDYPTGAVTDPTGPEQHTYIRRVLRGGSWHINPAKCRSAVRDGNAPGNRSDSGGFRVVLDSR